MAVYGANSFAGDLPSGTCAGGEWWQMGCWVRVSSLKTNGMCQQDDANGSPHPVWNTSHVCLRDQRHGLSSRGMQRAGMGTWESGWLGPLNQTK